MNNNLRHATNLIWLDLEMTGLNLAVDRVLEIAIVVTDRYLNVIAESISLAIYQKPSILKKMDEWNQKQHSKSGLIDRVKKSDVNEEKAEFAMLEFLKKFTIEKKSPMCGSSIYQDRKFLCKYMPKLEQHFHYKVLDVSSIKILAKYWYPNVSKNFKIKTKHLALSDIYDSINELKYYRSFIFKEITT